MGYPEIKDCISVGESVCEMACLIFMICEAEDDFCIQNVDSGCIIFGGTNRLVLNQHGFYPDRAYCTPRFLELYDEKYGKDNK